MSPTPLATTVETPRRTKPGDAFILGVDLDGVVADYESAFRHHVATIKGVDPASMSRQDTWSFAGSDWPIADDAEFLELHTRAVRDLGMFLTMPVMPGASDALWRLSDAGVWIRIITHRAIIPGAYAQTVADTARWLDFMSQPGRVNVPWKELCFAGQKDHVEADLYIDDAPHNIEGIRESGGEVLVFDQRYNAHLPGPRAADWDAVVDYVLARTGRS